MTGRYNKLKKFRTSAIVYRHISQSSLLFKQNKFVTISVVSKV